MATCRRLLLSALLCLAAAPPVLAQRALHWRALDVTAHLDAEGALHLVERHAMVFTGDWNGGERVFRIAPGQHLTFEHLAQLDPRTGTSTMLVEGDLSLVGNYQWTDNHTLRWRSRSPSSPPFANTELVYEIAYTLDRVLLARGSTYTLDHNFALPAANRTIDTLSVDIDLDPVWTPPPGFQRHRAISGVPPGGNFTVRADLAYTGSDSPAVLRSVPSRSEQLILFAILLAATGAIVWGFVRRESALGRFLPPPSMDTIDTAWLQERVFAVPPEYVAAAWDDNVGAPEVAALLARLTAEHKIESWTEDGEMSMKLVQPLESFSGYEASLLRALFFDGRTKTSTRAVKVHYETTGFNPADTIREGLLQAVSERADFQERTPAPSYVPTLVLTAAAVVVVLYALLAGHAGVGTIAGTILPLGIAWFLGLLASLFYQSRVTRLGRWGISLAIAPVFFLITAAVAIGSDETLPRSLLVARLLLEIAIVNTIFNLAKTRDGATRLARRRELAAARDYFAQQLHQPQPRLEDAWLPWLIAFELTNDVDRWTRVYGATSSSRRDDTTWISSSHSSSSSPSSSAPPPTSGGFTGGGGASGGAGASGSWAAAAAGLAAGVSAPSSSGSSGGGGGSSSGGSSGGGGGGGW